MNMRGKLRFGLLAALVPMFTSTLVLGAMAAASVSTAIGDWEGTIDTGSGTLPVILHISQAAEGKLTGSLDSPDQSATGIAIDTVTYKEPDVHFVIDLIAASFDGQMNHDSSEITGEWKQSGRSLPLALRRRSK
jgi:hypothetical protein